MALTNTITKRNFIFGGCCTVCAGGHSARAANGGRPAFEGCFISPDAYQRFKVRQDDIDGFVPDALFARDRHRHTTGDPRMDRNLDRAMTAVADLFGVRPAFGFYDPKKAIDEDDPDSLVMNAWATQEDTDIPGTKGTVAFGFDLFTRELEYDPSGSSAMAVIAHEFAHILQGNRGYLARIRTGYPRKSEINADFLAGYFVGTRKREHPSLPLEGVHDLFLRLGRRVENNPARTHGNSQERLGAAEAGFAIAYRDGKSLDAAIAAGLEYVHA